MYEFLVAVKRPVTLRGRQALQIRNYPMSKINHCMYTTKLYSRCIVVL